MTHAEVAALRHARKYDEHLAAARAYVLDHPDDVWAHVEAAYAHDRLDLERQAIVHYDAAYRLGVPADERRHFLVGFGSTLRNVGRADDAVAILAQAVAEDPDYPAFAAFLALALMSAGQPRVAVATLLGVVLDTARDRLDGYDRALTEYQRELLS
jgi:tetratricopeptide (TPR) repeat protein